MKILSIRSPGGLGKEPFSHQMTIRTGELISTLFTATSSFWARIWWWSMIYDGWIYCEHLGALRGRTHHKMVAISHRFCLHARVKMNRFEFYSSRK